MNSITVPNIPSIKAPNTMDSSLLTPKLLPTSVQKLSPVPNISSPTLPKLSVLSKLASPSVNIQKPKIPSLPLPPLPNGISGITAKVKNIGTNPLVSQLGSIGKGNLPSLPNIPKLPSLSSITNLGSLPPTVIGSDAISSAVASSNSATSGVIADVAGAMPDGNLLSTGTISEFLPNR